VALRHSLVCQAPPDLSRKLAALAVTPQVIVPVRRSWIMPIYAVTAIVLGVVLVMAGQVYGLALQELGVVNLWHALVQLPAQWLNQFYAFFPQGHYLIDAFITLQRALQWVLVGLLMWAVLEMRAPRIARVHSRV